MYRIFVVEDDAVIASAVQRHLESWGYQVACAVRFDDVLSDFAAFDPQLVLLDIKLYPRKWTRDFDPWPRSADTHLTHRGRSAAPVL